VQKTNRILKSGSLVMAFLTERPHYIGPSPRGFNNKHNKNYVNRGVINLKSELGHVYLLHVDTSRVSKHMNYTYTTYRKIPNINPGLIDIFKHILGGLYSDGVTF